MNKTLFRDYGKNGLITDAWNFIQSQLRCCAVDDNGWTAYRSSWWDLSVNAYFYNVSSFLSDTSSFYKRVPESCCLTLIDPLTGHPTGKFKSIEQCQGWQYGPPRFFAGAHNDAVYYRVNSVNEKRFLFKGCFSAIKSYLKRYSTPVGSLTLIASMLLFCDIEICPKTKEGFTSDA
nr:tetraspanin 74f [Hymenolepis microstoma]